MEKETPKKIRFTPIHEGMGFHPFSDGLPYAPASKASVNNKPTNIKTTQNFKPNSRSVSTIGSSSATAAARPQFVTKTYSQPLHSQLNLNPSASLNTSKKAQIPTQVIKMNDSRLTLQVLRKRSFAYLLDMIVHAGFWLLTNLAALFIFNFQIEPEIFAEHIPQFIGFFILSQWLFISLQEMLFETTLGKAFFNLEFKRNHGSLLFRSMVFMVGVLCFGLGFYFRPQDRFGQITMKSKIES